jgi:hypothetical protein
MSELTDVTRKLVAVFAADVEGYSRLMGADEVGTLKGLTERRAILSFIGEHRGRIANTAGDSVLAEFGSAVDAVKCAVDAQAALAQANATLTPDLRINFRIGVHIGDVMVRAGDLFGDGVNIAARLQHAVCADQDARAAELPDAVHRARHLFIRQQTAVINSIRAYLAEFGIIAPVGRRGVEQLLNIVSDTADHRLPEMARACLTALGGQLRALKAQILEFDRRIIAWHRSNADEQAAGCDPRCRAGVGNSVSGEHIPRLASAGQRITKLL